ncbi:hypothetical protein EYC80_000080 [Monilinia laxa]|uniref:Uncharacterized protein n=1 Tax=Monilinia laxa TaxID=61186 RepID=A0A5N6K9J4_MONLA|nr:hypothetical protein EYC80_000080 [Monilinia laxa]
MDKPPKGVPAGTISSTTVFKVPHQIFRLFRKRVKLKLRTDNKPHSNDPPLATSASTNAQHQVIMPSASKSNPTFDTTNALTRDLDFSVPWPAVKHIQGDSNAKTISQRTINEFSVSVSTINSTTQDTRAMPTEDEDREK